MLGEAREANENDLPSLPVEVLQARLQRPDWVVSTPPVDLNVQES